MKNFKFVVFLLLLMNSINHYSQQKPQGPKIKITGTVIEKVSKTPLEYATITFTIATSPKAIAGGITNPKGEFSIDITPGTYDIKIEFISFKHVILKDKNLSSKTNL